MLPLQVVVGLLLLVVAKFEMLSPGHHGFSALAVRVVVNNSGY